MIINLWLLFICLNVAFGLVHVPGSPLSVYQYVPGNNCFYPPGFEADPVAQSPIGANDSIDSMEDLEQEMAFPTNSTNVGGTGVYEGDESPFGFLDSLSRSLKSVETMLGIMTGGYVYATLDHIMIACEQDKDPNSSTYGTLIPMDDGTGGNVMWDYIKTGFHLIIGFLIIITIFYWVTGRGHILSS
jgi:hypothetical protein